MDSHLSVKQWITTLLLVAIPIVNICLLIMWGYGKENPRRNYARAVVIMTSCVVGFMTLFFLMLTMFETVAGREPTIGFTKSNNDDYEYNSSSAEIDASRRMVEDNERKTQNLRSDIEITEVWLDYDDTLGLTVYGTLVNNSRTQTYDKFVIQGNAYNGNGAILHTFDIRVRDSVPPGGMYQFEDWTINADTEQVSIIDVYSSYPY